MLCAEDELGLGDDHAGIVVLDEDDRTALGAPAQKALGLDDWMLEVNAPANRGDVLGHLGVARELVAVLRGKLVLPDADLSAYAASGSAERRASRSRTARTCPRYVARVIDGVTREAVAAPDRAAAARASACGRSRTSSTSRTT